MRTTITVDDDLLRQAKRQAAGTGRTLSRLVEEALRDVLSRRSTERDDYRFTLVTHRGTDSRVAVDLASNEAVRDLMDGL